MRYKYLSIMKKELLKLLFILYNKKYISFCYDNNLDTNQRTDSHRIQQMY